MTTHYVDIQLLPDPEFDRKLLLGALYAKLHRALVQLKADDIGVSFPGYQLQPCSLGDLLRLHGAAPSLQKLLETDWLRGMRDHVALGAITLTPLDVKHCRLIRRQFKTSVDRLRRRRMLRKGETLQQAVAAIPDTVERQPNLPHVHIRSYSTNQVFSLFLERGDPQDELKGGKFNSYGLSAMATVPWF